MSKQQRDTTDRKVIATVYREARQAYGELGRGHERPDDDEDGCPDCGNAWKDGPECPHCGLTLETFKARLAALVERTNR